jgi:acetyl-CoA carboxylase biotin carboxylase subunit
LRRILVANRGEIAMRVIRGARTLGLETVLAASEADLGSLPARYADRTLCIGPGRASESYLRVETIVAAALASGCNALHPGYGFLSEDPRLPAACEQAGITFIGPDAATLAAAGDKLRARELAERAGVPTTPGGPVDDVRAAHALAERIGYPVLVKAVGGGGGRGMKRVDGPAELEGCLALAAAEAAAAFDEARLYLERFVERGRHVEVQVLGDGRDAIHLGERDCSIQRRYQKLVEEACAPSLADDLRDALRAAAVRIAHALRYRGAGTVEFLVDVARGEFAFLEINARLQVEHPVTEAVTRVDLVAEQIAVAAGEPLRFAQHEVHFDGHAIECRINAEDPARDFRPSPGTVTTAVFPNGTGIRVDTHIESGARVPPFYDSLLAKIVVHAPSRSGALERMRRALAQCRIDGVATNLTLHAALFADGEFARGAVDTAYLSRFLAGRPADGGLTSHASR